MARADDAALTDYGTPLGLAPLRQHLARRMAAHGIEGDSKAPVTELRTQLIALMFVDG